MHIQITRQACCAADDQVGPLEMTIDAAANESLADLVSRIQELGFLQFSSTHSTITGRTGDSLIVRINSNKDAEYLVDARSALTDIIKDEKFAFRF